jgi:hypothetical protein
MLKNKWALYLKVLRFELKMVDIGENSEGGRRQYPIFRRTQNEAYRIGNVCRTIIQAST